MLNPDFKVIDYTNGDADQIPGTVLIHDLVGNHPSMITYDYGIAEALEELSGTLPDGYENIPEECEEAWIRGDHLGELSGLEAALGVRLELFEDFLEEHSGQWTTIDGRIIQDEPTWTYPDFVDETPEKSRSSRTDKTRQDTRTTGEEDMTTMIDTSDFGDIFEQVKERFEQWGEELRTGGWTGKVSLLIEGEQDYESTWVSPHVGAGFTLERSVGDHKPIKYDPEYEYLEGTDDENYPVNELHEMLMEYTGTSTYWYNLILRIHPEDGVRLSVIG